MISKNPLYGHNGDDLAGRLQQFAARLKRCRCLLDTLDREFDTLALEFESLYELLPRRSDSGPASVSDRGERTRDRELRESARAGVSSLHLTWTSNGKAEVRIGRHEPFTLSPRLAVLLKHISSGEPTDGGFVPWKTIPEIAGGIQVHFEDRGPKNAHAISELVRRLRNEFDRHGINRYLVQTRKRPGSVRLALRGPSA